MNKMFTIIVILLGLFAVFFVGMTTITYDASAQFTETIYEKAKENQTFDDFLAYQSFAYGLIHQQADDLFLVDVYHVVTAINHDSYMHQLVIFSIPLTDIDYASNIHEINDKTAFMVKNNLDVIIFDSKTDPNYQNIALSYGYNDDELGFIYQVVEFESTGDYQIIIHDYHDDVYYDETITLTLFDINNLDETAFNLGWSTQEISVKMDLTNKLITGVSIYMGIYLTLVIVGFGIYFTIRKINQSKIK